MNNTSVRVAVNEFLDFLTHAVSHYEKSSPTVSAYLDDLYVRINSNPDKVALSEITVLSGLFEDGQWEQGNFAASRVYKLAYRLGRDTTGYAGF